MRPICQDGCDQRFSVRPDRACPAMEGGQVLVVAIFRCVQ
jgi:hypothetical protein